MLKYIYNEWDGINLANWVTFIEWQCDVICFRKVCDSHRVSWSSLFLWMEKIVFTTITNWNSKTLGLMCSPIKYTDEPGDGGGWSGVGGCWYPVGLRGTLADFELVRLSCEGGRMERPLAFGSTAQVLTPSETSKRCVRFIKDVTCT